MGQLATYGCLIKMRLFRDTVFVRTDTVGRRVGGSDSVSQEQLPVLFRFREPRSINKREE
jgi:hypothetical protein